MPLLYNFLRYFSLNTNKFIRKTDKKLVKNTLLLGTAESHALPIKLNGTKVSIYSKKLDKGKDLSKLNKEIDNMRNFVA